MNPPPPGRADAPSPAAAPAPAIRARLARALLLATLAWALGVAGVLWLTVEHEVDEVMDSALQEAAEIVHGVLQWQGEAALLRGEPVLPAPTHNEQLVWQLVDARQRVLLRSHHAPTQPLLTTPRQGLADAEGGWRVYGQAFGPDGHMLYLAQTQAERMEAQLEASEYTIGGALAVGLLCALWLSRRVGRELQPLEQLSRDVAAYQPLQPGSTLPDPGRAELQPLHAAVRQLGQGLARRVENEQAFAAHAAHALRTPLAGLGAQLAVAAREVPEAHRPRLLRCRQGAERLAGVVSALLTLFRAGSGVQPQILDLPTLLASLPSEGLTVVCEGERQLWADPDLLAATLANLLENARRHRARTVWLRGSRLGQILQLDLLDDGEGLSPGRREALQQALADPETHGPEQGLGLGLRLAQTVARRHGGHMQLLPAEQGFALRLHFPAAPTV